VTTIPTQLVVTGDIEVTHPEPEAQAEVDTEEEDES
jgi:hypothetical protein